VAQNHHLEAKKGCRRWGSRVRDLLSIYGFRGGVEPMVGQAVQRRGLGGPSPLTIVLTVSLADGYCRRAPRASE
jgi:hypothetical protein